MTTETLARQLGARDHLSDAEKAVLESAVESVKAVPARQDFVRQGERLSVSILLLDGFAAQYKILESGARQITAIHVAGDFLDLHGFLLHRLDHGVVALSDCRIATMPHEGLRVITETQPHLTRLLWLTTIIDGAIHRQWLVTMGRMGALGQLAHLLCELRVRLGVVGLADSDTFQLPMTQEEFADVLGLSPVHVNRSIQELRRRSLISWQGRTVVIQDWDGLVDIAEFDSTYLNLVQEPR